jgi:hypothetical protein
MRKNALRVSVAFLFAASILVASGAGAGEKGLRKGHAKNKHAWDSGRPPGKPTPEPDPVPAPEPTPEPDPVPAPEPTPEGTGIPFGAYNLLDHHFRDPYSGALAWISPETVVGTLEAARQTGTTLVVIFASGSKRHYQNPDESFNLELWKARLDRYAEVDLDLYIEDGTLALHQLVDEPKCRSCWGGEVIPDAVLDEMAWYSKLYWPDLPTAVRAEATKLEASGWFWQYLDAAWAQYSARKGPVEEYLAEEVASAKAQGLGLMAGMNVINGGDGSSGIASPEKYGARWAMSPEELRHYGSVLIGDPYTCGLIMWRYYEEEEYFYHSRPEIDGAMFELLDLATQSVAAPCWHH